MKKNGFKLKEKWVEVPIVQGGMGVGISLGGLAGAVAKAGGVGLISTAQIGFKEPDFDQAPLVANIRAMQKEYDKARETSPFGVVGFNIMTALANYKEYVTRACELGADVIVSGAGLPVDLPAYVEGFDTAIAPIVSTVKSAKTLLRYWAKKYDRIPDLLVIEGPMAGGHLGFTTEQLAAYGEPNENAYEVEIQAILREKEKWEKEYNKKIPVVVAGGIDSREAVTRAMNLGADGVQVGTRFVTTVECDASLEYKMQYLNVDKNDIKIIKSPVGMPGRAIETPWLKRIRNGEKETIRKCHACLKHCDRKSIPYCITDALIAAAKGDMEHGLVFCGANVYKSKKLEKVAEVIDSLMK